MNYIIKKLTILILLFSMFASCKKFVNIDTPTNQLGAAAVFTHDETATTALTTVYAKIFTEEASPYIVTLLTGLQGDEFSNPGIQPAAEYYINAIDPVSNLFCKTYWDKTYNYIYLLNSVLEGCAASTTLTPEVKKQVAAEALFTRAYLYFYLVNLYGAIPLSLGTDYSINRYLVRKSVQEIYEQIIEDLKAAQQDLNTEYVGKDSWPGTTERVRPNKAAATALLARVYLYNQQWALAESHASSLIENTKYSIVPATQTFLKGSAETIWALRPSFPNYTNVNTVDGSEFILQNSPVSLGKPFLNRELVNCFDEEDLRKTNWIGEYIDPVDSHSTAYFYPFKYKVLSDIEIRENTILLRLAEQYLIRAEAKAMQGSYSLALKDINVIRERAGIYPLSSANTVMTESSIMQAILKERRREFFAELGHRWFDLKRTQSCDSVMKNISVTKKSIWNPAMQLWPIPAAEILLNSNLEQSAGYRY